jgi:hypothetical protein
MVENNHLILYNDGYVVGALIYDNNRFNYMQYIQHSIMDMFNLSIDEVNDYMKIWIRYNFDIRVHHTDGVFGHN